MESPEIWVYILPGGMLPKRGTESAAGFDVGARAIVSPIEKDKKDPRFRKVLFDFESLPSDPEISAHIHLALNKSGEKELAYRLYPGEKAMVAVGFVIEMPASLCYVFFPRSGLISVLEINLMNSLALLNAFALSDARYSGGAKIVFLFLKLLLKLLNSIVSVLSVYNVPTVMDADYRGEGGIVLRNDSDKPLDIFHNMRIAQIVFLPIVAPSLVPSPFQPAGYSLPIVIPKFSVVKSDSELSDTKRGAGGFGHTGF